MALSTSSSTSRCVTLLAKGNKHLSLQGVAPDFVYRFSSGSLPRHQSARQVTGGKKDALLRGWDVCRKRKRKLIFDCVAQQICSRRGWSYWGWNTLADFILLLKLPSMGSCRKVQVMGLKRNRTVRESSRNTSCHILSMIKMFLILWTRQV